MDGGSGDSLATRDSRFVTLLLAFTVAFGASLLFLSEPAAGKTILPWLGGTPAAWGTTLLFFQLALILGYTLVDQALRRGGARGVGIVHSGVLLLASIALLLRVPFSSAHTPEAATVGNTLALLTIELGVPIVALTLTAPALQAWAVLSRGDRGAAGYALYAASNTGSLLGLLAYPFLVEPNFGLSMQWSWWRLGFWGFSVLAIGLWGHGLWASKKRGIIPAPHSPFPITHSRPLEWAIRAAIPAALLAAVTAYLTRDLAPIPLLWVIPLALYLATWIAAFSGRTRFLIDSATRLQDLFAVVGVVILMEPPGALIGAALGLLAMVIVCLAQHGALARSAPPESELGRFYVWLAAGGAFGTALVVVVGPALLPLPIEAPLILALAVALGAGTGTRWNRTGTILFLLLTAAGAALPWLVPVVQRKWLASLCILAGGFAMVWRSRPRLAGASLAALTVTGMLLTLLSPRYLAGAHGILGRFVVWRDNRGTELVSGSTWHGFESRADSTGRPSAWLYYTPLGPYGDVVRLMEARGKPWSFGVVGLGIGSLACTAEPGTRLTFFEINEDVVRLARDTTLFRTLTTCAPEAEVRLGDARLTLAETSDRFNALTLDAFNSDAIPTHLLTRESLALYRKRIVDDGVIAFHLSNRYLNLPLVVNALAADAGWAAVQANAVPPPGAFLTNDRWLSWITMVTIARDSATLAPLVESGRWHWSAKAGPVWTDDWTPVAGVLRLSRENLFGR